MTHSFRFLATVLFTLALVGCGLAGPAGNGKLVTQTREVPAFKTLSVSAGVKVTFSTGPRAVSVTADENLVDDLLTEVVEGVLVIRVKHPIGHATSLEATVSNDVLESLSLSGGSGFTGPATATGEFVLDASGGSTAEVSKIASSNVIVSASGGSVVSLSEGTTTSLVVSASGGSKFNAHGFIAEDAVVEASGGSEICLTATKSITGNASGGSIITVSGAPATKRVNSSGGSRLIEQN